jgi:Flp pilus assembly protein TadD
MNALLRTFFALLLAAVAGCNSSPRSGPYASSSEASRDPNKAQQLTLEATELMDSDPAKAEALLRKALSVDLWHGPAHNDLGVIHLQRGELYEAANEFEWARKLMHWSARAELMRR